jgi:hypothetical protein
MYHKVNTNSHLNKNKSPLSLFKLYNMLISSALRTVVEMVFGKL